MSEKLGQCGETGSRVVFQMCERCSREKEAMSCCWEARVAASTSPSSLKLVASPGFSVTLMEERSCWPPVLRVTHLSLHSRESKQFSNKESTLFVKCICQIQRNRWTCPASTETWLALSGEWKHTGKIKHEQKSCGLISGQRRLLDPVFNCFWLRTSLQQKKLKCNCSTGASSRLHIAWI